MCCGRSAYRLTLTAFLALLRRRRWVSSRAFLDVGLRLASVLDSRQASFPLHPPNHTGEYTVTDFRELRTHGNMGHGLHTFLTPGPSSSESDVWHSSSSLSTSQSALDSMLLHLEPCRPSRTYKSGMTSSCRWKVAGKVAQPLLSDTSSCPITRSSGLET